MTQPAPDLAVLELNETGFEILRAAVRIARDGNVKRLEDLRSRLAEIYPDDKAQIEVALSTWAKYAQEHRDNGD